MADLVPTERTRLRRLPERGSYDRATIESILDEALICHVGFVDDGMPVVIPTIHARVGETLYLHGSPASRMLRTLGKGARVCVTATVIDGIVLARSHFHSSMNYRSVMVFGTARRVDDPAEKAHAFEAVTEHVAAGRWLDGRRPTDEESRKTAIVAVGIDEASAKIRRGGPNDDPEDVGLDVWAGVIPLQCVPGPPQPVPDLPSGVATPSYAADYTRP